MFHALDVSTSALVAQRHRLDVIAGNIANINTTRNEQGQAAPFQRRLVTLMAQPPAHGAEQRAQGVEFRVEVDRQTPPRRVFQPGHPDADAEGYVAFPEIDLTTEFVNALEASRAYEANVAAIEVTKEMASRALRILA
jgi:flagellar basal-body rod protein FlgC